MKNILCGAVAAIALVAAAAPASAQTSETHYAGTRTIFFNPLSYQFTNPGPFFTGLGETYVLLGFGTRYTAEANAPADSQTATPTVSVAFNLSGKVNKDCSFYAGNGGNAQNIDFGVIGVRTGDNENVNNAFDMVGPAVASIETLTAGCNFNNNVTIEKDNVLGLVNTTASGFDSDEFQNNIQYEVNASWNGTTNTASGTPGSGQTLNVSPAQLSNTIAQGAWRSDMTIDINAPVAPLGLVAGDYEGTMTLTLAAVI